MVSPRLSHEDYRIAWICAIPLEMTAAKAMLDRTHDGHFSQPPTDHNAYTFGQVATHNVVIACLPSGNYGVTSAAIVLAQMLPTFPSLQFGLMVGIGGGVPGKVDIRLGDVVVSQPTADTGGVVQHDFGKRTSDGGFQRIGSLNNPPQILLTAISQIQSINEQQHIQEIIDDALKKNSLLDSRFSRPKNDWLFHATYNHQDSASDCSKCDQNQLINRQPRATAGPNVHYGLIASGNQVMKDAQTRDQIADELGALCFEMEAAGLVNQLPTLVIRGICDYCDSHKQDSWQRYAAVTAASYAKLLLAKVSINNQKIQSFTEPSWMVPFEKNMRFLGRSHEVANIEKIIMKSIGIKNFAISGLGGVGKTQIALALAFQIREKDPGRSIFWIPSTSFEAIEQAYFSIGKILGIKDTQAYSMKRAVQRHLSSESASPWLLIIDGADDIDMWTIPIDTSPALIDFLPRSNDGFTLFTTRNEQLGIRFAKSDVMQVSEMDVNMAKDLLKASLVRKDLLEDGESTASLIKAVNGLPLAIIQAASFINTNKETIAQYVSLLNNQESDVVELLSQDFEDDSRYKKLGNPVGITWLVSFEQIKRSNALAAKYLSFMSCIDSRDIPRSLLPREDNSTEIESRNALGLLKSYSFITEQAGSQSMSIHRLVHLAMRNWLRKEGELDDCMIYAREQLAKVFPSDAPENRRLWREYLPHAQCVLRNPFQDNIGTRIEFSDKVGKCLHSDGRYYEASVLFYEVYHSLRSTFGPDHPDTLRSMSSLGWALTRRGQFNEAEKLQREALERRKKVLGPSHTETIRSLGDLGAVLDDQGKYEGAETMHRRALDENEKIKGPYHLATLTSASNLGWVLYRQGKYKEAETMSRRALDGRTQALGMNHPDTLTSANIVGMSLVGLKKYKEAERISRQTLERRNEVLGSDHPSSLRSANNLGLSLSHQQKYEEAEEIYRRAFEGKKKLLGHDHPDTLTSMWNLSDIWKKQGKESEALELLQDCVQLQRRILGPNHPHTESATKDLYRWKKQQERGKLCGLLCRPFRNS